MDYSPYSCHKQQDTNHPLQKLNKIAMLNEGVIPYFRYQFTIITDGRRKYPLFTAAPPTDCTKDSKLK